MQYRTRLFKAFTGCAAMLLATTAGQASDMGRRYLAIDQTLHVTTNNMHLALGQATNSQEILKYDAQWEIDAGFWHNIAGSVTRDHEGIIRKYYPTQIPGTGVAMAVAYSTDGINWTKPQLNLSPHLVDHPDSNLIYLTPHASMSAGKWPGNTRIFYDAGAPASQRYKAIWTTGSAAFVATSSDGLSFGPSQQIFSHRNEANVSAFWDPNREAYVMYGRIRGEASWTQHGNVGWDPARRGAALHYSTQFQSDWHTTGQVGITVLDPEVVYDYNQDIRPDFYAPNINYYHGNYIGLPATYFRDSNRKPPDRPDIWHTGTGPIYPIWMHSLNGVNFFIPDTSTVDAHSAIDLTPHLRINPRADGTNTTDLEVGQMYPASTFLEMDDKILVYYAVREDTHYEQYPNIPSGYFVAELRRDGFASLKAEEGQVGEWRTAGITVPTEAKGLEINANVDGSLRVEIWKIPPFPGTKMAESLAFTGDKISHLVRWDGLNFEDLAGQNVQFRFFVEDGEIYSFQFSPIPEPASLVLMGLGGLALLRRRRNTA